MERYSDKAIDIINGLHTERIDYESEYIPLIDCANQCTACEDTGLTPESVEALKLSMMGKAISEITEFEGLPIGRIKELAEADKEGRVIVLPVKVGDAYYTIESFCTEDGYYDEKQLHHSWDCEYCSMDNCDEEHRVVEHIFQSERAIYEKKEWLGECAWLTRKEAEEALRRAE